MKIFKPKVIKNVDLKVDYYERYYGFVYKLDFNDCNDFLLFDTLEDMHNYVLYHGIKDYTYERVEIISNYLRFL